MPTKSTVYGLVLVVLCVSVADRGIAQVPMAIDELPSVVDEAASPAALEQRLQQLEANQQRIDALLAQPYEAPFEDTYPFDNPFEEQFEQNVPGAELDTEGGLLPRYYFSPSYYNTYEVGARALPDYAPPGYEARDQQEGPADPEYERITAPPLITTDERTDLVTRGLYPGSFLAPGTATSVRLGGFVRLAGLFDFDPIGVPDAFVTNSIPAPQGVGQNLNFSGRISRFNLETWTPTAFRDWNVHTFIEGDFFNGPGQAAGGGGNPFRLRHAFFDFGYFRLGQQNSVFMDPSSWPSLVDFQGPNSWVNQRQPSVRITIPIGRRIYWATSIERPFSDITALDPAGASLGRNVQDVPDFATHWRCVGNRGHIQLAGLLRTVGFRPNGGSVEREAGGGISGTTVLHPWAILLGTDPVHDENPSGLTRSRMILQGTTGSGVGRYLNDLAGQGFDAQVDPITGDFDLVDASGWNASYEHWFGDSCLTNFTYGHVSVDNNANLPTTTYDSADYLAASVWWIPVSGLALAIEFMDGERQNLDGQTGRAQRLHSMAQYNF